MEKHILTIKHGQVTLKVEGVKGKSCLKATQEIEQALGATVSRELTKEYHASQTQKQDQTQDQ